MKTRTGFISNSSSTSFVINTNISRSDLGEYLYTLFQKYIPRDDFSCFNDYYNTFYKHFRLFCTNRYDNRKILKYTIWAEYYKEYWEAFYKINEKRSWQSKCLQLWYTFTNFFRKSYLQEALRAKVFGITSENFLPYELLEELQEHFGKDIVIHHLG